MNERDTVREALSYVPAHDRDTWLRMGMAVKSALGENGFDLWDEWSSQDESYNQRDARTVWKSIHDNGRISVGTLYHEAQRHGFKPIGGNKPKPPIPEEITGRERKRREEAQEERDRAKAAQQAAEIWKAARPATDHHPYLKRKGVKAHGLRLHDGRLVVPMRDASGALHSLQSIGPDGEKLFLPGGRVKGCYVSIGKPNGTLCIVEGYATGASIHEATGYAVAVAFNAGNLEAVAKALRAKFPQTRIVIAGDNDVSGTGQRKAEEAGRVICGLIAVPDFGTDRPDGATDFNDLALARGPEAVKAAIEGARPVDADTRKKFRLVPIGELLSKPQEQTRWLVDGLLPAGGISVLAARPKVGKSTLARSLGVTVARGGQFLGRATAQGSVFILDLEGKAAETINSLRKLGATETDPVKVFCGIAPQGALNELRTAALGERPALIIVDTLQRLARVPDLNDYARVMLALDDFIALARDTGAHVVLLHHQGRGGRGGVDSPMGSTAIAGSVDTILTMRRRDDGTRTLSTVQRYGADLDETVVSLDACDHVTAGGLVRDHEQREAAGRILAYLKDNSSAEQADIREGVEGRWSVVRSALTGLYKSAQVTRTGTGRKGDAYRYSAAENAGSADSHTYSGTSGTRIPETPKEGILGGDWPGGEAM